MCQSEYTTPTAHAWQCGGGAAVLPQVLLQAVIWPGFYGDTNAFSLAPL